MEQLAVHLHRIVRAAEAYRRLVAYTLGVGLTDTTMLSELWYGGGALTPSVLADRVGLTTPGVTAMVDRLELVGLVARRRHPQDRRSVFVELTDTGTATMATMHEMFNAELTNDLAPQNIDECARLLTDIVVGLEARRRVHPDLIRHPGTASLNQQPRRPVSSSAALSVVPLRQHRAELRVETGEPGIDRAVYGCRQGKRGTRHGLIME